MNRGKWRSAPQGMLLSLLLGLAGCLNSPVPPTGTVVGTVVALDAAPVVGAAVTLTPLDQPGLPSWSGASGADGRFTLERVPVGAYGLTALTGDDRGAYLPELQVAQDESTIVTLEVSPLGAISGAVLLSDKGARPIEIHLTGTHLRAQATSGGAFSLPRVPPGSYELVVTALGYDAVTVDVTVTANQEAALGAPVVLQRRAPYARFDYQVQGATVLVDGTPSADVEGNPVSCQWRFGDEASATGCTARHTFTSSGGQRIALTVVDGAGNRASISEQVEVTLPSVTPGTVPGTVVATVSVGAGLSAWFDVQLNQAADLLYLEVSPGLLISARQDAATYFSSAPDRFGRGPDAAAAGELQLQAVVSNVVCQGPCILLGGGDGAVSVGITNPSRVSTTAQLRAYVDAFSDEAEPNDSAASATPLAGQATGAIELVGDRDLHRMSRGGLLTFQYPVTTIPLRATLHRSSGGSPRSLRNGQAVDVTQGDLVVIEAAGSFAAPAGSSLYFLSLE